MSVVYIWYLRMVYYGSAHRFVVGMVNLIFFFLLIWLILWLSVDLIHWKEGIKWLYRLFCGNTNISFPLSLSHFLLICELVISVVRFSVFLAQTNWKSKIFWNAYSTGIKGINMSIHSWDPSFFFFFMKWISHSLSLPHFALIWKWSKIIPFVLIATQHYTKWHMNKNTQCLIRNEQRIWKLKQKKKRTHTYRKKQAE